MGRQRARAEMARRGQTLYDVLGVSPTTSAADIRSAYHDLAKRFHPDRHEGNTLADLATEKLASINAAYEVLSDPQRRAAYDAELAQNSQQPRPRPRAEVMLVRAIVLIVALVILVRVGPILVRALWNLMRMLWESAGLLRGTPLYAVLFLAGVGGAVLFVLRRAKARRRK